MTKQYTTPPIYSRSKRIKIIRGLIKLRMPSEQIRLILAYSRFMPVFTFADLKIDFRGEK